MECRLCLFSASPKSYVSIHDNLHPLAQRIWSCCRLQVNKDDGLPDGICLPCVKNLELLSSFRSVCLQSDETSKRRSNQHSDIKIEEVFLDDVIWEDESSNDSPASVCNSPVNDELVQDIQDDTVNEDQKSSHERPVEKFKAPKNSLKRRAVNEDPRITRALSIMDVKKKMEAKKHDDIFAAAVAMKLRKIKDERTKMLVQRDIDILLYDAIIGTGKYAPTPMLSPYPNSSNSRSQGPTSSF
ncbi:uncharacterized protein LOC143912517 [Arctopsyche grandis]|uniref:uncharacterized protein LOC143912517 n=1 Tax=Arctopsyche grandis TaxID=121162 RepID=UPI00406D6D4F